MLTTFRSRCLNLNDNHKLVFQTLYGIFLRPLSNWRNHGSTSTARVPPIPFQLYPCPAYPINMRPQLSRQPKLRRQQNPDQLQRPKSRIWILSSSGSVPYPVTWNPATKAERRRNKTKKCVYVASARGNTTSKQAKMFALVCFPKADLGGPSSVNIALPAGLSASL